MAARRSDRVTYKPHPSPHPGAADAPRTGVPHTGAPTTGKPTNPLPVKRAAEHPAPNNGNFETNAPASPGGVSDGNPQKLAT